MILNFFSTTYLFRHYFIKGGKKIILTVDIFSTNLELKHDVSHHMDFSYFSWEGGCSLPDHPWVKVLNFHNWIKYPRTSKYIAIIQKKNTLNTHYKLCKIVGYDMTQTSNRVCCKQLGICCLKETNHKLDCLVNSLER